MEHYNNWNNVRKPIILVVEDDKSTLLMLEEFLIKAEYDVITATNCKDASEIIEEKGELFDAILLDRMMPGMDGIELLKWLRTSKITTPVIMQTGSDASEQIREGIENGVFYYLTKPVKYDILRAAVDSAVKESIRSKLLRFEMRQHGLSLKLTEQAVFSFKTPMEAEYLSCFIANLFPDPDKVLSALAILFLNAVEHGNLGVSYEEKTSLIATGNWNEELDRRSKLPEFKDKKVRVIFERIDSKYYLKVIDQGKGFNWKKYINFDPSKALDKHGRGVSRVHMIFDGVKYNEQGNEVAVFIDDSKTQDISW